MDIDMESSSEVDMEFESDSTPESSHDSDFDDVLLYVKTLNFKLRKWAVNGNIDHKALSALLKLLKDVGHKSLPKDARTLLETPKKVDVVNMGAGKFWYGGMTNKLKELSIKKNCTEVLELVIHFDGTPPYKSTRSEFWPCQCSIKGVDMRAFFVSLYLGRSKPKSAEEFLRPFLNEVHDLLENGLTVSINGIVKEFTIKINKIILDAPARAFLKCIIGHAGYFSCERCEEEGVYLHNIAENEPGNIKKGKKKNVVNGGHVCLIGINAPIRTNESFRTQRNEEHHHDDSPLEELPIDMVRDIPLEYLHLVLYGVMKKLLTHWTKGTKTFKAKLSASDMNEISKKLIETGQTKPSEINKPNRSLDCLSFWKATEFRTFVLKTGPVVMRDYLSEEVYNHFLALHCGVSICCSKALLKYLPVAKSLFKSFNEKFGDIYGYENYTYSIHSLVHVTDDVERFGVFDDYSAFPGESNLGYLKSMLRGGYKPLQQVVKRIAERDMCEKLCEFIEDEDEKQGLRKDVLRLKGIRLDSSEKNRWILTKNLEIFKIQSICEKNNSFELHGAILHERHRKNLFERPIESKNLYIFESKMASKASKINLDDMFCKLYRVKMSEEESAFFPLSHFTQ